MPRLVCPSVVLVILIINSAACIQLSVGVEHDLSKPTYGLQGRSTSSIHYDDRNGLSLGGTIGDLLGPPIKIATGLGNIVHGGNMAGLGTSLRTGGALLGIDAKMLEAAGGLNMAKGGLLLGGAAAKSQLAGALAGPKGQKLANIIEVPVKVVAMKDLAAGKALSGLGQLKQVEAQAVDAKGQAMFRDGQAIKSQGFNQVIQGATEGVQNIGNMVQKTAENVGTAFRYLPLIMELQQADAAPSGSSTKTNNNANQPQQQHLESTPYQLSAAGSSGLTGGSPFGGLSSLMPGFGEPFGLSGGSGGHYSSANNANNNNNGNNRVPTIGNLFGAGSTSSGVGPTYAAMVNSSSPLMNLLLNPGANPFLLPFAGSPLSQALVAKQPFGTMADSSSSASGNLQAHKSPTNTNGGQSSTFSYNLLPGIKFTEKTSSHLPTLGQQHISQVKTSDHHQEQQQQQQQQQI